MDLLINRLISILLMCVVEYIFDVEFKGCVHHANGMAFFELVDLFEFAA